MLQGTQLKQSPYNITEQEKETANISEIAYSGEGVI